MSESVMLRFVVEGELVEQPVTEAAAWNVLKDLHEIFGLPMPVRQSEPAAHLKVLVE
jgi:hypothetical protein